jgi:hypothetical protein
VLAKPHLHAAAQVVGELRAVLGQRDHLRSPSPYPVSLACMNTLREWSCVATADGILPRTRPCRVSDHPAGRVTASRLRDVAGLRGTLQPHGPLSQPALNTPPPHTLPMVEADTPLHNHARCLSSGTKRNSIRIQLRTQNYPHPNSVRRICSLIIGQARPPLPPHTEDTQAATYTSFGMDLSPVSASALGEIRREREYVI